MKQNCFAVIINLKTLVLLGSKMSQRTTGFYFLGYHHCQIKCSVEIKSHSYCYIDFEKFLDIPPQTK